MSVIPKLVAWIISLGMQEPRRALRPRSNGFGHVWIAIRHIAHTPKACVVDRRTVGIVWFLAKQIFSLLQRSIEPCGQSGRSAHCVPLHMVWQP